MAVQMKSIAAVMVAIIVVLATMRAAEALCPVSDLTTCTANGAVLAVPPSACCSAVKKVSLDCLCAVLKGAGRASDSTLIASYVSTCSLSVPSGFKCQ